jgi:hypothetical protein
MSETDTGQGGIEDEDLPVDLRPTEDNPLAQDLDEDEAKPAEELDMHGGKTPDETDDTEDSDD